MACTVCEVGYPGVVRKWPRLVNESTRIDNRRVVVVAVFTLAGVGSDVRHPEARIPHLVLEREVVLHAVGHLEIGVYGSRKPYGRQASRSGAREDAREDHVRVARRVRISGF